MHMFGNILMIGGGIVAIFAAIVCFFSYMDLEEETAFAMAIVCIIFALIGGGGYAISSSTDTDDSGREDIATKSIVSTLSPSLQKQVVAVTGECYDEQKERLVAGIKTLQEKSGTLVFAQCSFSPTIATITDRGVNTSIDERVAHTVEDVCLQDGDRYPYTIARRIPIGAKSSVVVVGCDW